MCDSRITYQFALLTGDSAAKTLRKLNIMNVASISESTYYRHTSSYINPVIIQQWNEHQQQLLHSLSGNENGLVMKMGWYWSRIPQATLQNLVRPHYLNSKLTEWWTSN